MSDGGHQVILYIPECPILLLGRDLLSKLGAQVTFSPEERPTFQVGTMTYLFSLSIPPSTTTPHQDEELGGPEEHERKRTQLFPEVWVEDRCPPPAQAG